MKDTSTVTFEQLIEPTAEIAAAFTRWENEPTLIPFMRPNANEQDLLKRSTVTEEELKGRLEHHHYYLIYLNGLLIGEMDYQIDPAHLYKKEASTAWVGITIGEASGRSRGIGYQAMQFLESQIQQQGFHRIELGVFEFNNNAFRLYQKLGYIEIGRIDRFTYWHGKMWQDVRMEKYI